MFIEHHKLRQWNLSSGQTDEIPSIQPYKVPLNISSAMFSRQFLDVHPTWWLATMVRSVENSLLVGKTEINHDKPSWSSY